MADPAEDLRRVYERGQRAIIERLLDKSFRGTSTEYERSLLGSIGAILQALHNASRAWVEREIPNAYSNGLSETRGWLEKAGAIPSSGVAPEQPGGVHRRSIETLAHNLYDDLTDALQMVGRRVQDLIRDAGLEATSTGRAAGETVPQIQTRLEDLLAERGITSIEDSAGRQWRPDAYAAMAARTTLTEVQNLSATNELEEVGEDLVQITDHRASCPICAKYEGRVYSITGSDDRYPALRGTAFGVATHTIHPNCRHRLTPYIEEFADNPAADRRLSNRPFEDDRSEAQKRAYDREQARKRRAREARRRKEAAKLEGAA